MEISYKLDEKELEILKKAEDITCTDYGIDNNLLPADAFIDVIEDLIIEIDGLNEKIEDIKRDIEDNYKPLTEKDLYGDYEDYRIEKGIIN